MIITPPTNGGIVPPWMLPKPDPNTPRVMQPSEHRDGYEQIIGSNIVAWLDEHGRIENSDDDPFDDKIIAAWERLSAQMAEELTGIDN